MTSLKTANTFRKYHRLLGFFLAGVMTIYSCSGVLLVFRTTDFLKYEKTIEKVLAPGLSTDELGQQLRLKGFKIQQESVGKLTFEQGIYDKRSGRTTVTTQDYPLPVKKLVDMHKATTNSPLFFMNILFGCSLLFFAVSSFFMFLPKLPVYKTGLKFAAVGLVVALVMVLAG